MYGYKNTIKDKNKIENEDGSDHIKLSKSKPSHESIYSFVEFS
jgi:hypothetical protein